MQHLGALDESRLYILQPPFRVRCSGAADAGEKHLKPIVRPRLQALLLLLGLLGVFHWLVENALARHPVHGKDIPGSGTREGRHELLGGLRR